MVHGGDGFAFVIHLDPNATKTLGQPGEGLGYAGIRNSLVVEFDTWYNPSQGDHFTDHVRWGKGLGLVCYFVGRLCGAACIVADPVAAHVLRSHMLAACKCRDRTARSPLGSTPA